MPLSAEEKRTRKAERDRAYREANREAVAARKRRWYAENQTYAAGRHKARYHAKRDQILEKQKDYLKRKTIELGENPGTVNGRRWREKNRERAREIGRNTAARLYRADPMFAAKKRAKSILHEQTGVPVRLLPNDLVDAKACQLLVLREILRPDKPVGWAPSEAEKKVRKAESWRRWYERNKAARSEYNKTYRQTNGTASQ